MSTTNIAVANENSLKVVTLPEKINVLISSKAYAQISYLLQRIHDVEWSAILLYTSEGHITSPEKMSCRVDSIYLMDKGSSAYTEHEYDTESIVGMFNDFPEYMNMKMGHIHSHNEMGSFFSGTDMNELKNNVVNHAYYLSLIVNNKGSFIAKLCYVGKQHVKVSVQNKVGKWVWGKRSAPIEEEVMFVHDCNMSIELADADKFVKRVKEITSKVKPVTQTSKHVNPYYHGAPPGAGLKWDDKRWDGRGYNPPKKDDYSVPTSLTKYSSESTKSYQQEFDTEAPKRSTLAKYLISCDMNKAVGSLSHIADTAEKAFIKDNDDTIIESYKDFYTETSPTFLAECFNEVYGLEATEYWDRFEIELERAADLIPGRVGDCIREAIDDIIVEWQMLAEENGEIKIPDDIENALELAKNINV